MLADSKVRRSPYYIILIRKIPDSSKNPSDNGGYDPSFAQKLVCVPDVNLACNNACGVPVSISCGMKKKVEQSRVSPSICQQHPMDIGELNSLRCSLSI
ncbi:MAG: hypothetical protein N2235_18195 [Fischerella sp.]|nr:hypothetical protein [Fischerella sp.]